MEQAQRYLAALGGSPERALSFPTRSGRYLGAVPDEQDHTDGQGRELTDDEVVDVLPEQLQPLLAGTDYVFPNNSRRRVPAVTYLLVALVCVVVYVLFNDAPAVNGGWLGAAVLLAAAGVYCWLAGANLAVDERDALVAATADVGFPVGHASVQLSWRGPLCRPTWRVLLYSAEEQPVTRALVLVDGFDAKIIERVVEDNPEDWAELS